MANRNEILKCLGDFPKKCDLDIEIIQTIQKETHTLQLVRYNVEEQERVDAWLLVPEGAKKRTLPSLRFISTPENIILANRNRRIV